jgi:formylglycine-generating enzyme required for sulfatase activity
MGSSLSFSKSFSYNYTFSASFSKEFTWKTGNLSSYWYQVRGCCKSTFQNLPGSGCPPIRTDDAKCDDAPTTYFQTILSNSVSEICQELTSNNWNWQLCSVKKWSRPAENLYVDLSDECNVLQEVSFKDIPECQSLISNDVYFNFKFKTTVYPSYSGSGFISIGGCEKFFPPDKFPGHCTPVYKCPGCIASFIAPEEDVVFTKNDVSTPVPAGGNFANFNLCADWDGLDGNVTTVGSNGGPSAYGTYDMNGNVWEWNDLNGIDNSWRQLTGGSWYDIPASLSSSSNIPLDPFGKNSNIGFRLASSYSTLNPLGLSNFVTVGDIDNDADTGGNIGKGSVSYIYSIQKYTVTNSEYAEFLNAVAATDDYDLYHMDEDRVGIIRSGSSGSYSYSIKTNYDNKPVNFVRWFHAARYANWLHNEKPTGVQDSSTTEDGAYTLNGVVSGNAIARNSEAKYHIPTLNEWYKAAYYKGGGISAGYWKYATQSDDDPTCVSANINNGDGIVPTPEPTPTPTPTETPEVTSTPDEYSPIDISLINDLVVPIPYVNSNCPGCNQIPARLYFQNNLINLSQFSNFIYLNNKEFNTNFELIHSRLSNSWTKKFYYESSSEKWFLSFDLACINVSLAAYYWKFAMIFKRTYSKIESESKLVVQIPSEFVCAYSTKFEFKFNFDVVNKYLFTNINYFGDDFIFYDKIGLFNSKYWNNNPKAIISIREEQIIDSIARKTIDY